MADHAGSLEHLAVQLARVLTRVTARFGDQTVLGTFDELGVRFPDEFLTNAPIAAARHTIFTVGAELDTLTTNLTTAMSDGDDAGITVAAAALLTQCGRVTAAFPELATAIGTAGPTLPGITQAQITELVQNLPGKITDLLLADLLEVSKPTAALAELFGVLGRTFHPGDPDDRTRPPYEALTVHLDRLLPAVTNPVDRLAGEYGWGTPSFDVTRLLTVLESVFAGLLLPVVLIPGTATTPPELQAFVVDLGPTADGAGLRVGVVLPGAGEGTVDIPLAPPALTAQATITGTVPAETEGEIRPPGDVSLTPPSGDLTGSVTVGVRASPAEPVVLLGITGGTRLEVGSATVDGGLTLTFDPATGTARATPVADGEISGGRLVIDTSGGDGFVATVIGDQRVESEFSVGFTFAPDTGLRFTGSGGLEIQIPAHVELGPIAMEALYLRAGIANGSVPVELSAAFSATLGPVRAIVDRIGAKAELTFPEGGGNLGPANLAFGFKPPSGVGLVVDAGAVTGGGFLGFDPDRGEYSGTMELEFAGFLAVKAIGLITTRQPDGSPGFSLLVVLTAEFGEGGLQLGFGFTLLAVGGVLGLNRGVRIQAIMDGLRTGAIESVMFPRDVVANAPRILSDLAAFFPPEDGAFLIGPMAKIGWGTPALVTASVGVIIQIPGDIAVLGVLKVALPSEDEALLLLQVDFAGAIEFDKKRIFFNAALYRSRILSTPIDGEMGVLVAYGDEPEFVVSVGGFHPDFRPPPLPFPVPRRISLNLLNTSSARISGSGYFAVTSNTVQFGAEAELFFGFSDFSLTGHVGFDGLFRFSPFQFAIDVSAHASVKVFGVGLFGVGLDLTLSGPAPWRAAGTASISFFFFSIGIDFDVTWGEERDTTLPPVEVLPLLAGELNKAESWRTRAPVAGAPLVSLRALDPAEAGVVLHPLGTLVVSQRVVPLDITVDRIGAERAADVSLGRVSVEEGLVRVADATEQFAIGQFEDLSDAEKLSRPSFERQHSGLELASDGAALASLRAVRRSARYEEIVIDPVARDVGQAVDFNPTLFAHFLDGASVGRSPLAQAEKRLRQPFTDGVAVTGDAYAVASTRDNTTDGLVFDSEAQARTHLRALLDTDPGLLDTLHVIPAVEVAA
ncbi:hypothetical protein GCM10027176_39530 [Actinoallomurus bryophytorum]|uniref:DUF6603 domain-containing protein n=1 Tax=Actinoallomurus bryophytorum TaxID=1490222 RepID=A0A543CWQ9_9ACTN|nr:DUF6603 domain-containing protein [Actinoallomurus bryophytorum]TQM01546.1 hypothetical protein FB559_7307 [Actinoallomurus bryophytorum]